MFKKYVFLMILILVFSFLVQAQTTNQESSESITVDEIAVCTSIAERQPVGVDTAFVKTIGQLFCFVKLSSEIDSTSIFHTWFYNDKEMAKVELSVKSKTWRTWSSKKIVEDWVGNWKIEISSAKGDVLKTTEFIVK